MEEVAGVASPESRCLTSEEQEKLEKQNESIVSDFKQNKLEIEARKNWDLFYKRNGSRFFRDRHWSVREFEELLDSPGQDANSLLEVGCGVGNFILPLVDLKREWEFYACDFSPRAILLMKEDPRFAEDRVFAFVCDLTSDSLIDKIGGPIIGIISMIFVLSAIHPEKFEQALSNITSVLKPGGVLIFRDYGIHDMAQIRFGRGNKLSDNFYVRQDGTRSYFFTMEILKKLVAAVGLEMITCCYIHRRTVNKKENVDEPRVFLQGKFRKPC